MSAGGKVFPAVQRYAVEARNMATAFDEGRREIAERCELEMRRAEPEVKKLLKEHGPLAAKLDGMAMTLALGDDDKIVIIRSSNRPTDLREVVDVGGQPQAGWRDL